MHGNLTSEYRQELCELVAAPLVVQPHEYVLPLPRFSRRIAFDQLDHVAETVAAVDAEHGGRPAPRGLHPRAAREQEPLPGQRTPGHGPWLPFFSRNETYSSSAQFTPT